MPGVGEAQTHGIQHSHVTHARHVGHLAEELLAGVSADGVALDHGLGGGLGQATSEGSCSSI